MSASPGMFSPDKKNVPLEFQSDITVNSVIRFCFYWSIPQFRPPFCGGGNYRAPDRCGESARMGVIRGEKRGKRRVEEEKKGKKRKGAQEVYG